MSATNRCFCCWRLSLCFTNSSNFYRGKKFNSYKRKNISWSSLFSPNLFKQNQILGLIERQTHKLIVLKNSNFNLAWIIHLPSSLPPSLLPIFLETILLTISWNFFFFAASLRSSVYYWSMEKRSKQTQKRSQSKINFLLIHLGTMT